MGSVVPLINCLSKCLRPKSGTTLKNTMQPIDVLDTRRFDFYAPRIRVLCVFQNHITACTYRQLSLSFSDSDKTMLHYLLRLTWTCLDIGKFPYIALFAGPMLQYVTLFPWHRNKGSDDLIFSSVSNLVRHSPRLHHAAILDEYAYGARETTFFVSAFRHLTSIVICTTISADLIAILASMPKLRTLQLDYQRTMPPDAQAPLRPGVRFAALEVLGLEHGELESFTLLFESLGGEHGIKCLDVDFDGCATGSSIARFIQALANAVSQDTLSHFTLFTQGPCEKSNQPSHAVDDYMLRPLLEFRKMDYFLLTCCGHAWDNRFLEDMARAWPALHTLGLQPHSGSTLDIQLTLAGLYPLAKHCPQLNYIDVVVAPFESDDRLPNRDWEPVTLQRAEPMTVSILSRKVDRAAIAFLQDMFPRLLVGHLSVNDMAVLQYMKEGQNWV